MLLKIKRKHYLFSRFRQGAIPAVEFKRYETYVQKEVKKHKRKYFLNKFNACAGNSKETWKLANSISGTSNKKTTSHMMAIVHEGNQITDPVEISNLFNDYFVKVGSNLASNIDGNTTTDPLSYMGSRVEQNFYFFNTDADEVSKLISTFKNKKTTINNIPPFILKKISPVVSPMLAELFNDSISSGTFPELLKTGRVIPIHKSGSLKSFSNYRPITTLSIFSKVFEKLVHKRMVKFIDKFNLLNINQFGFQKNKNTSDAILEFLDNVYDSFNQNEWLLAIYLDFSKAFDTISLDILLKKLDFLGFRGLINSWIKSYLLNRKQFVNLGNKNSTILETLMGVPQGSTLGPLFFILYINDMKNCLSSLKVLHFADDSTLYKKFKSTDIVPSVNADLASLNKWLSANKLYLNVDKTKYMTLKNRGGTTELELEIGNSNVQPINVHKFLGVWIDENLNFATHAAKMASKVASGVGMIRKLRPFVPKSVLLQLHYAFVYSKFTYAITTYGSSFQNSIQRLSNLVNKSLKLVMNTNQITLDVCQREKLFNFQLAHKYFTCIKMYQIVKLGLHPHFSQKFSSFQTRHEYETRQNRSELLTTPLVRNAKCQRSFLYLGVKCWNELPLCIRDSENQKSFKINLRKFIFS